MPIHRKRNRRSPWTSWLESCALHMLVRNFLCTLNDTRALVGPRLLVTSHCVEVRCLWASQVLTITHIIYRIGLSLPIHCFIHLSLDTVTRVMSGISVSQERSLPHSFFTNHAPGGGGGALRYRGGRIRSFVKTHNVINVAKCNTYA